MLTRCNSGVSGVGGARDGQGQRGHAAELWWLHIGEGFTAEKKP
ncbi:hypothetical protein ES332_A10G259500v1 [Gossypium tomentosum]|uniref:Uncharacterized protein n=1 Tax=Gossypium tomentosum TaxID=34277 RepID=A0A5D2NV85_GOSTO|nr:hypothetical protein ES332_A10G259500v1 [Gossypium tomentosum]